MRIKLLPVIFGVAILGTIPAIAQNAVSPQSDSTKEVPVPAATTSSTEDVALGEPLKWSLPKYPKQARRSRMQGTVVLMLNVNEQGRVSGGTVVSGDPLFAKSATDAVKKWEYVPFDVNGRTVAVTTKAVFGFSMSETGSPKVAVAFRYPTAADAGPVFKVGNGVSAPRVVG